MRRDKSTLNWTFEAGEPLTWLAEANGLMWMQRELVHKKAIHGGLLNKSSGILTELTFRAMLDELKIPHTATESILDKKHSVNAGKIFDFRLSDGSTIDLKALPPCNSKKELKLNQKEAQYIGVCDYYVLYACSGTYTHEEIQDMRSLDEQSARLGEKIWRGIPNAEKAIAQSEFSKVRTKLHEYITKIKKIEFITFV